jgi:hypothetical protein
MMLQHVIRPPPQGDNMDALLRKAAWDEASKEPASEIDE